MPITIVDYDPNWTAQYTSESRLLMARIGQYIEQIEHVGSTSVPGLAAKPIIDILIGVQTLKIADTYCIQPIVEMGYIYKKAHEVAMPFRRYFYKLGDAHTIESRGHTHHIHLVETGCAFWKDHLLFRDYLRSHPKDRNAYAKLKRELAPHFENGSDYATAKTEFIEMVKAKARLWRTPNTDIHES